MKRTRIHTSIHLIATLLLAFTLPLARMMQLFIIILMVNWLVEGDFVAKWKEFKRNSMSGLFIGFYLLHVVGLLYTENSYAGNFDIQVKLGLLLFPLLYASRPLQAKDKDKVFYAFIGGALASSVFMLSYAFYTFRTTGVQNFFYEQLAFYIHPSYLSMYINLMIVWLLFDLMRPVTERKMNWKGSFLLILFLSMMNVLLSSKLGLLTLFLVFAGFVMYYIVAHKKYLMGLLGILGLAALLWVVMKFVPEVGGRIQNAIAAVTSNNEDKTNSESTAVRMLVWKASNEVIKEHPIFGVGTGDSKDALLAEYQKEGLTGALEHRLNCHNEYYQVFVSLGLIGFLLLMATLLLPMVRGFKKRNYIYCIFLLIVMLNFATESMLETQAGVLFIGFFNALLYFEIDPLAHNLKSQDS